jgi:HK97 family phage major capsid protein
VPDHCQSIDWVARRYKDLYKMADLKILNQRKAELVNTQESMLNAAMEAKVKLTAVQEEQFKNASAELADIEVNLSRFAAIAAAKSQIGAPTSDIIVPTDAKSGDLRFSAEYHDAFWNRFKTRSFSNTANLNEGSNANGDYLVPIRVDGEIVPLAAYESSMRKLANCIPTTMDIKLPSQATRTVAAAKAESTNEDVLFGGTAPTFGQVTLVSHMAGVQVPVSFELMQDVPALQAFLNADILRGIQNWEELNFISGVGDATHPQGILTGATAFESASLSIDSILDLEASLPAAYYNNASYLMNRKSAAALKKAQLAVNQFQSFWTSVGPQDYLNGFPVFYSSQMPTYAASPAVSGAVAFGDFKTCATIGTRGGISVRVLDQIQALSGCVVVLGYERVDQKIRVPEAVNVLSVNG